MTSHAAHAAHWSNHTTLIQRLMAVALAGGVAVAACVLPAPVWAQQAVTLASLQISIWPEFDRPSSLVILDGQLASSVPLPAELTVGMPAAAQAPNAVAVSGTDGSLLQAAYTTAASGGDIIIKFTTNSAVFRVEYYDPGLVISGDTRSFAFRWKSDFAIGQVAVRVQEPVGARNLTGQPALTPGGSGEYGLNYDTVNEGALAAGGTVSLDLSYTKSGSALSATAVGAQSEAGSPAGAPVPVASAIMGWLPWALGAAALGLVLVGGGALWYARPTPTRRAPVRVTRSARPGRHARAEPSRAGQVAGKHPAPIIRASGPEAALTNSAATAAIKDAPAVFCPQCGQRYQARDRFCRNCGAPVRE